MISTVTMIKSGKVYGNLMVDVQPTNEKLVERCKRIVMEATGCDKDIAKETLEKCNYSCKVAIIMILLGIDEKKQPKDWKLPKDLLEKLFKIRKEGFNLLTVNRL